jgi:release factor glutamine methyltransferase
VTRPADAGADGAAASWDERRAAAASRLDVPHVERADLEATWLVEEASGMTRTELFGAGDRPAGPDGATRLDTMVTRRVAGEPIQYVLGHWPFRSLDLLVDRRVLIPRPETEQVAECALVELDRIVASRARGAASGAGEATPPLDGARRSGPTVVDLGTGSGALALAIATERPDATVWAVEQDADALAVARANRTALGSAGSSVSLVEGSWFDPLPADLHGRVDLVVSNPPYVRTDEVLPRSVVEWEPTGALFAGPDGLAAITVIVAESRTWLGPDGVLVVEIGAEQGSAVGGLAHDAGFEQVEVRPDLAGRDRVLVARRAASVTSGSGSPRRSR